jgi:RNA polymerase sigma-70 factor (ECF subfamily)
VTDASVPGLDELFTRYAPYVAKIGLRLLGRDHEVDDLVQDVFLAAHRGLRQIREREAIKGWLATVTVRLARRRLRARRIRTFLHLDGEPEYTADVADEAASPEQRTMLAAVYGALDRLPVDHRLAWSLRYIEGEQLENVAVLCNCSLATAKRRIKAAHAAIQEVVCG